jgi:hypothetical protein
LNYALDVMGTVFAADLVAASLTGRFISVGRGGGKNITIVKRPLVRVALAVVALCIVFFVVIDLRRKFGR